MVTLRATCIIQVSLGCGVIPAIPTMVTGGNDTTTGMLGGSMPLLHERPDQRRLLVDNPALIPDASGRSLHDRATGMTMLRTR